MNLINSVCNSAKRLLLVCVIDLSPSTEWPDDFRTLKDGKLVSTTANELINKHINLFISQLLKNTKIKAGGEVCFVTYSTDIRVSEFIPIARLENNVPHFTVMKGGTHTFSAIEAAYKAIDKRIGEITSLSIDSSLYTSAMFLFTDGDESMHDSAAYRKQVTKMVNERTLRKKATEKVLPFIVGLGSNLGDTTKKQLADLSKGFLDGSFLHIRGNNDNADKDYSQLFHFFGESIVTSVNLPERIDFDEGFNNTASTDELLSDLRNLIYEVYPNMVCTVSY